MMKLFRLTLWALVSAMLFTGVFGVSSYAQNTSVSVKQPALLPVSINNATAEELQAVKGIGEVIAERIVEYRKSNGPFEKLDELMEVRGIGQAKFERIKEQIAL